MEEAVSERRKVFAAAHRSDENRQAYISASRHALSVITKAKAEAWQTTGSSFSPKSNPKCVYFLLGSAAGFSSSSFFSPNFPSCSSPRESALVFADYLRSHFSISQPNALRNKSRGYHLELGRTTCPEEQRRSSRPPNPQLGGPGPTLGAQVSLKLLFGYVTIFSSADLFTTDLNCRKKLACDIISECNVILSRRI